MMAFSAFLLLAVLGFATFAIRRALRRRNANRKTFTETNANDWITEDDITVVFEPTAQLERQLPLYTFDDDEKTRVGLGPDLHQPTWVGIGPKIDMHNLVKSISHRNTNTQGALS